MFAHQPRTSAANRPAAATGRGRPPSAAQLRAARLQERSSRPVFGNIRVIEDIKDGLRDRFNPENPELVAERKSELMAQQLIAEIAGLQAELDPHLAEYEKIYRTQGSVAAQRSAAYLNYKRLQAKIQGRRRRLEILTESSENMQNAITDELTVEALAANNRAASAARARQHNNLNLDEVIEDADENFAEQQEIDRSFLEDFRTLADRDEGFRDADPTEDPMLAAIHERVDQQQDLITQSMQASLIDLPVPPSAPVARPTPAPTTAVSSSSSAAGNEWENWLAQ